MGTAALDDVEALAGRFRDRLVVAIDARDGRVVSDGWLTETDVSPRDLAHACAAVGVARLLVTSTSRDGSLAGPDVELLGDVLEAGLPVLAAGGVASLTDLRGASRPRLRGGSGRKRPLVGPVHAGEALALRSLKP